MQLKYAVSIIINYNKLRRCIEFVICTRARFDVVQAICAEGRPGGCHKRYR